MLWAKVKCFYAHVVMLLLPVPDNSASQSCLSACDAQWAATTEKGRLFQF